MNKLKKFFQNEPFEQGSHPKVRFYSWSYTPTEEENKLFNKRKTLNETLQLFKKPKQPNFKEKLFGKLKDYSDTSKISIYSLSEELVDAYLEIWSKVRSKYIKKQ